MCVNPNPHLVAREGLVGLDVLLGVVLAARAALEDLDASLAALARLGLRLVVVVVEVVAHLRVGRVGVHRNQEKKPTSAPRVHPFISSG